MSKTQYILKDTIMNKIRSGEVKMKPKWYFIVGSIAMISGLIGSAFLSIFLVSLIAFSLRTHGPMGVVRYQQLLSSFPWWAPFVALCGLASGIFFLKQYDFSYKKNFVSIMVIFILTILLSGWLMDYTGIHTYWSKRGSMRRLYIQSENSASPVFQGRGMGRIQNSQ